MDIRYEAHRRVFFPYIIAWGISIIIPAGGLLALGAMADATVEEMFDILMLVISFMVLSFLMFAYAGVSAARRLKARYGLPDTLPEKAPAAVTMLIQRLEAIGFEQGGIITFGPVMLEETDSGRQFEATLYEYVLFEPAQRVIAKITRRNTVPDWSVRFVSYWSDNRALITENQPEMNYDSGFVRYQTTDTEADVETTFSMHRDTMQQIQAEKGRPIPLHLIEDVVQIGNAKRARDTGAQIVARRKAFGCLIIQVIGYGSIIAGVLLLYGSFEAAWQVILS